jgi:hypothetical protein
MLPFAVPGTGFTWSLIFLNPLTTILRIHCMQQ